MAEGCCSCEEVQRILEEIAERIIASCQAKGGGAKQKRAPSPYNMFIKECMGGGKSDMKSCAAQYKQLSDVQKEKYKKQAQAAA